MNKNFLTILITWNNEIKRGAQVKLAKQLGIKESIVSMWVSGTQKPGEANIKKMAVIFQNAGLNISEEELNSIFGRMPKTRSSLEFTGIYQETPIAAIAHAGEVVFVNNKVIPHKEKPMKIVVKVADDSFLPLFQKDDELLVDTNVVLRKDGICLAKTPKGKYSLFKFSGCFFDASQKPTSKKGLEIIGWVIKVSKNI